MKKFFAVCLLTTMSLVAMDKDQKSVFKSLHPGQSTELDKELITKKLDEYLKDVEPNKDETVSNTEEEKPKYESMLFKAWEYAKEKRASLSKLSKQYSAKAMQSSAGQQAIGVMTKILTLADKYPKVAQVLATTLAGTLGYLSGNLVPVSCVDLPGVRPSCVVTSTPIGAGICFPLAYLVCKGIKPIVGLGSAAITYLLTQQDTEKSKTE